MNWRNGKRFTEFPQGVRAESERALTNGIDLTGKAVTLAGSPNSEGNNLPFRLLVQTLKDFT